ncbi:hypothetical protein [Noviherbaspirillum massiliense]|uniref:hypothetical protein n=1 Tax=Noviherbaspirillum massiliense TaxID=1465823 RepID=UPI0011DDA738|nr:hypothetical protein [Noviherbaspirillum massiliense]
MMKVELDIEKMQAMLEMWRNSTDLQVPMTDGFRLYLMKNRHEILGNLLQAATALNLAMSCMKPLDDDAAFDDLKEKLRAFIEWAAAEIDKLDLMTRE